MDSIHRAMSDTDMFVLGFTRKFVLGRAWKPTKGSTMVRMVLGHGLTGPPLPPALAHLEVPYCGMEIPSHHLDIMVEAIVGWYLPGNHHSRVSQELQDYVHARYHRMSSWICCIEFASSKASASVVVQTCLPVGARC